MTPIIIVIWLFSSFYPYTNMEERLSDTKGVIRSRKSNDRQYNDQMKRTNNNLQNNTQKTKDRATRTPLKTGSEHRYPRSVSSSR
jgi:hypothetical protein